MREKISQKDADEFLYWVKFKFPHPTPNEPRNRRVFRHMFKTQEDVLKTFHEVYEIVKEE